MSPYCSKTAAALLLGALAFSATKWLVGEMSAGTAARNLELPSASKGERPVGVSKVPTRVDFELSAPVSIRGSAKAVISQKLANADREIISSENPQAILRYIVRELPNSQRPVYVAVVSCVITRKVDEIPDGVELIHFGTEIAHGGTIKESLSLLDKFVFDDFLRRFR